MRPGRQTVELVAGAGVSALLTLAYIIYVGRVVGPSEYSDFAAALSVIYFVGLALSPLTPTVARLAARYESRGERHAVSNLRAAILGRMGLAGAIAGAAGAVVSPFLADAFHFQSSLTLFLAFAAVIVYSIISIDRGIAQGLFRFRLYNANTIVEAAVRLVAVVIGFAAAPVVWVAVAAYALALGVAQVALASSLRQALPRVEQAAVDWSEVKRLTLPIMMLMFSLAVFQNADMIVVKRFFDPTAAGLYGAAAALARGFAVVFVPFYVMAGPLLTGLHESGRSVFARTIGLTTAFIGVALAPLMIVIVWPDSLLRLLFGADFVAAGPLVAPLCGLAMITCSGLMLSQALVTLHEFRFLAGYGTLAILQIGALIAFHDSYAQVVTSLYVCQSAAAMVVASFFMASWRRWRPAGNHQPPEEPPDHAGR